VGYNSHPTVKVGVGICLLLSGVLPQLVLLPEYVVKDMAVNAREFRVRFFKRFLRKLALLVKPSEPSGFLYVFGILAIDFSRCH
jgi:hypothetical protein